MTTKLFIVKVRTTDHDSDLFDSFAKHVANKFAGTAYHIVGVQEAVTEYTKLTPGKPMRQYKLAAAASTVGGIRLREVLEIMPNGERKVCLVVPFALAMDVVQQLNRTYLSGREDRETPDEE